MEPEDKVGDAIARMAAEEDQAQAGLLAMANRVTRYRQYLILGGLPIELADQFTLEFHTALLDSAFGADASSEEEPDA